MEFKGVRRLYYIMESPLPEFYRDANETIQNVIITLGVGCYLKLFRGKTEEEVINKLSDTGVDPMIDFYEDKIDKLTKVNVSLKKEMNDNYEEHIKKVEEQTVKINSMYNFEIDKLKQEIIIINNTNDTKSNTLLASQRDKHDEEIQRMNNTIETINGKTTMELGYKDEQIKSLNIENENKQSTIDEFIGRRKFKNNTEQGNYGEKIIDELVEKGLSWDKRAECVDSSKVGGSGDRIIKFSNGKSLMIEVKFKGVIKKEDREQFETHYQKDFEEKKCDAALFLSLMSEQIPTIGDAPILHYEGNVGYYGLSDERTMSEKKHRIVRCIHEMYCKMGENENKVDDDAENKTGIYNLMLEILVNQKRECERVIKIHQNETDKNKSNLIGVNQKLNDLYREIQVKQIIIDKKLIDEKLYLSELIKRIREWKVENNITFRKGGHNKTIIEKMTLSELDRGYIIAKKIKQSDLE